MDTRKAFLTGKVAAITGAGSGIGKGIAKGMAAFGAKVAILERDPETSQRCADEIGAAGGEALSCVTDVRDAEAVERALAQTCERWRGIDVLVNNAGGVFAAPFMETDEKGWNALWRANMGHVFTCSQAAARRMIEQGRGGSIINVVSIEGVRAAPLYAAYAAAKAGVINFTKTLALELAPHAIRVNAIAPDICITEGLRALMGAEGAERAKLTVPLGRVGVPEDIAGPAIFLASDLASYVTGALLHVDGGTAASSGWYHHPRTGVYVYGPAGQE
jgi:NAD(P)-dependent dehydrogenase (short-subunit alcohol dehydrogenase family)